MMQKLKARLKIKKGSILGATLIILGIMLVSALSFSLVSIQERKASTGENKSNQALQTAGTGVEIVLQSIKNNSGGNLIDIDSDCDGTVHSADGSYAVQLQADDGSKITGCSSQISAIKKVKSVGTIGGNQRAVEVAVAGTCMSGQELVESSGNKDITLAQITNIADYLVAGNHRISSVLCKGIPGTGTISYNSPVFISGATSIELRNDTYRMLCARNFGCNYNDLSGATPCAGGWVVYGSCTCTSNNCSI